MLQHLIQMNGVLGKVFECAKLASKVIDRQKEDETNERPKTWTTDTIESLVNMRLEVLMLVWSLVLQAVSIFANK